MAKWQTILSTEKDLGGAVNIFSVALSFPASWHGEAPPLRHRIQTFHARRKSGRLFITIH
jgi:hypothetical protein